MVREKIPRTQKNRYEKNIANDEKKILRIKRILIMI